MCKLKDTIDSFEKAILLLKTFYSQDIYKKDNIEKFTKTINANNFISMLIGSTLGTILFNNYIGEKVYYISIFFFLLSALLAVFLHEDKPSVQIAKNNGLLSLINQFRDGLKNIKSNRLILKFILLFGLLEFLLQPFFNYWQPISVSNGISSNNLFIVYILIQLFGMGASYCYNFFIGMKSYKKFLFANFMIILIVNFVLILSKNHLYILVLLITTVPRTWININIKSNLQKRITNDIRSTITSISSSIERLFSFATLLGMSFLSFFNLSLISILFTFSILYVIASSIVLLLKDEISGC